VRELRNVLERAALLSEDGIIHKTGLEFETFSQSATATGTKSDDLTLRELEKQSIVRALDLESGNVNRAAKRLGIHRSSLYSKMREIGR
jgi:transcriptional regulator of acetoin/glycerol metabolism